MVNHQLLLDVSIARSMHLPDDRELRLVAHQGVVEMYDVRITLGDGDLFRPEGKLVLDRGEGRTINLPGDLRSVRNVNFVYRSLRGAGQRATISLYGR